MAIENPFYVIAPRYDPASAGNRVLYAFAQKLGHLGYDVHVVISNPERTQSLMESGPYAVRFLNQDDIDTHFRLGRTPITIYPEISTYISPAGTSVFYLLNYVGLLSGPADIPECDYVLAYAENIARRSSRCDQVLYIPVSDPDYWQPDPSKSRDIVSVYAGKYVDHHHQSIPPYLSGAFRIERHGPNAPTREQLRDLLQRSTCLHIFENTAVATEALLCGCPVVYHPNPYFLELIAEHEHDLTGVTCASDPDAITEAAGSVPRFRESYLRAQDGITGSVAKFALAVQALARRKRYVQKFDLPIGVGDGVPSD